MAFWIDSGYLDNALTAKTHTGLTSGSAPVDAQYIALACGKVTECARRGGYSTLTPTLDLTPFPLSQPILQAAALAVYLRVAMPLRRDIVVPKDLLDVLGEPEDLAIGKLLLPDFPQDPLGAAGGGEVTNSGTANNTATTRDPIMSVPRLFSYP